MVETLLAGIIVKTILNVNNGRDLVSRNNSKDHLNVNNGRDLVSMNNSKDFLRK